jgi:hypothetical protein
MSNTQGIKHLSDILVKLNEDFPTTGFRNHCILVEKGKTLPTIIIWVGDTSHKSDIESVSELEDLDRVYCGIHTYITSLKVKKDANTISTELGRNNGPANSKT